MRLAALITALGVVSLAAACTTQMSPEKAAQYCEERARAAMGPQGSVSMGVNSKTGTSVGFALSVSSDYLEGRDPMEVYENCVIEKTGQLPYRPPVLQ